MRVTSLELENFRCFEREAFAFREPFTVLIGENGAGKSALLAALRFGVGTAMASLVGGAPRLAESDVRLARFHRDVAIYAEKQFPAVVHLSAEFEGRSLESTAAIHHLDPEPVDQSHDIDPWLADLIWDVREGGDATLPLVAVYGTGRTVAPILGNAAKATRSRLDGYAGALDATVDGDVFTGWLRQRTGQSLEIGRRPADLDAVLSALDHALPSWNGVRFDFTEDALMAVKVRDDREEDRLPFRVLSDGQRALLGLMCDIAYRCAVLNPQLGSDAARATPGVVLIDEIDLHLHPRWQRGVVDSLTATFPGLQFIASSHSPFIIQALSSGAVIDLSREEVGAPGGMVNEPEPTDFRKQSIEDIAEETMGVSNPQWSLKRQEWWLAAERYYTLLEQHGGTSDGSPEVEEAKRRLDIASLPFAEDTGFAAMLALEAAGRRGR